MSKEKTAGDTISASKIRDPHPCWRYRKGKDGVESRLFEDVSEVPKDGGWEDTPAAFEDKKAK